MSHSERDARKADERRYNEKNDDRREDRRENDKEARRREDRRDRDHERQERRDDRREERVTYRKEVKEEFDEHENCSERVGKQGRESRRDDIGEPSKSRHRHTSRSDSEATSSQGDTPEKQPLSVREKLLAMSTATGDSSRGKWLTQQIEEYKKEHGVDSDSEPTEEEIRMQLKLPSKKNIENKEFKEPLTNWITVENTGIPGWNKELLPEEEIVRPPDWKPPTPPKVDISLQSYKEAFDKEESPKLPAISNIERDKEKILRGNFRGSDEFVLYNNSCIIRTTKRGIEESKEDREKEERNFGGGGFSRGRGGRGGGRGDRRSLGSRGDRFGGKENRDRSFKRERSISSSPGRDARGQVSRRDDEGSRRVREERRESHHQDRSDHKTRNSFKDDDRSRSPRDRRLSSDYSERRPPSPYARRSVGLRDDVERRETYGSNSRDERGSNRRNSDSIDRRSSSGLGYNNRESGENFGGNKFNRDDRRDSYRAEERRDDRRSSYGDIRDGDRQSTRDGYGDHRSNDSRSYARDDRNSQSYNRGERNNVDHHGSRRDHYEQNNAHHNQMQRQPQSSSGSSTSGVASGTPLTYKEWKAMKAAKEAAGGR